MANWADSIDTGNYGKSTRSFAGMLVDPLVFFPTALLSLVVIVYSVLAPDQSASLFNAVRVWCTTSFDWFFMAAGNLLLLFCVAIAVSPLGRIRLGGKGATPDYSRMSWFSMLFGAGMGIGLVFYGVSEPVSHFTAAMAGGSGAPLGGAVGNAAVSRDLAMAATIFDWALHPWAIFAVAGLAMALFTYDFGMPLSMRSAFYPLFGKAVWGRLGDGIEVLAVFATIFGLATSLGLGAQQAMAGVTFLYRIPSSPAAILVLIGLMFFVTFLSVRGGMGGYVCARQEVIDLLRQRARPYLFSNALAPGLVGASLKVFDLLEAGNPFRTKLFANAAQFRSGMAAAGFTLNPGEHPIIPVMLGDARLAQQMAAALLEEGIYVTGFSFPVVPRGQARIRTQLSAAHTPAQIERAIAAFTKVGRELKVI